MQKKQQQGFREESHSHWKALSMETGTRIYELNQ